MSEGEPKDGNFESKSRTFYDIFSSGGTTPINPEKLRNFINQPDFKKKFSVDSLELSIELKKVCSDEKRIQPHEIVWALFNCNVHKAGAFSNLAAGLGLQINQKYFDEVLDTVSRNPLNIDLKKVTQRIASAGMEGLLPTDSLTIISNLEGLAAGSGGKTVRVQNLIQNLVLEADITSRAVLQKILGPLDIDINNDPTLAARLPLTD